jgi:hypothetical protein
MALTTHPAFRFRKIAPNFGNNTQHTSPQAGYVVLYWWLDSRVHTRFFATSGVVYTRTPRIETPKSELRLVRQFVPRPPR